jgi:hypothetical protein
MICETCRWSGKPGFVLVGPASYLIGSNGTARPITEWRPCPTCGGTCIDSCCDGAVPLEQDVIDEVKPKPCLSGCRTGIRS